jgi:hypothetical protein
VPAASAVVKSNFKDLLYCVSALYPSECLLLLYFLLLACYIRPYLRRDISSFICTVITEVITGVSCVGS